MKKLVYSATAALGLLAPSVALAQGEFQEVNTFVTNIIGFINGTLVPLIFAVAFLVFLWGAFQYFIMSGHSEEGQKNAKNLMIWGLAGFFVMVTVWGLVNLLVNGSGLGGQDLNNIPDAPTQQN